MSGFLHTLRIYPAHSIEIAARILVSGFLFAPSHRPGAVMASRLGAVPFLPDTFRKTPPEHATHKVPPTDSYEMNEKASYLNRHSVSLAELQRAKTTHVHGSPPLSRSHRKSTLFVDQHRPVPPTIGQDVPFQLAVAQQQYATSDNAAYLRHSWNRLDLLAVASFWIAFVLALGGWEASGHIYIFRMLSVLRAARLLTITAGTTVRWIHGCANAASSCHAQTILQSLKRAAPLLVTVAFFVLFAIVLFRSHAPARLPIRRADCRTQHHRGPKLQRVLQAILRLARCA
jgi:hypothetical protein